MKRPAIRICWSKRERDWMHHWPDGARSVARYLSYILGRSEVIPPNGGLPAFPVGGLLSKEVLAELDRLGVDTRAIRITLPMKQPTEPT